MPHCPIAVPAVTLLANIVQLPMPSIEKQFKALQQFQKHLFNLFSRALQLAAFQLPTAFPGMLFKVAELLLLSLVQENRLGFRLQRDIPLQRQHVIKCNLLRGCKAFLIRVIVQLVMRNAGQIALEPRTAFPAPLRHDISQRQMAYMFKHFLLKGRKLIQQFLLGNKLCKSPVAL